MQSLRHRKIQLILTCDAGWWRWWWWTRTGDMTWRDPRKSVAAGWHQITMMAKMKKFKMMWQYDAVVAAYARKKNEVETALIRLKHVSLNLARDSSIINLRQSFSYKELQANANIHCGHEELYFQRTPSPKSWSHLIIRGTMLDHYCLIRTQVRRYTLFRLPRSSMSAFCNANPSLPLWHTCYNFANP